jgi:hypothetical protein
VVWVILKIALGFEKPECIYAYIERMERNDSRLSRSAATQRLTLPQ